MVSFPRSSLYLSAIVLGFLAATTTACAKEEDLLAGRPECPHDWDLKTEQNQEIQSNIAVPEFNDCQRFIVSDGATRKYGALYAIFAADTLTAIQQAASAGGSRDLRDYIFARGAIVVAKIYAEGRYDPLGIERGLSCLFVFRDSISDGLTAKMIWMRNATAGCREIDYRTASGKTMPVYQRRGDYRPEAFPPVARWDWDSTTSKQYIGFGCAAAWCEVGDNDLQDAGSFGAGPRTKVIKGWYDYQLLAQFDDAGRVTPSRIRGTIFPDSSLHFMNAPGEFEQQWKLVAEVALDTLPGTERAALDQYKARMNFDVAPLGGPLNQMYLCYDPNGPPAGFGPAGACPMTNLTAADQARLSSCKGDGRWWARVDAATDGTSAYYCVVRRGHEGTPGFHVPGTARWRWMASDEGTWKKCVQGCCETLGG